MDARCFSNYTEDIMKSLNSYIFEKFRINKDSEIKDNEEYWFTKDFGISLPFTLRFSGRPEALNIEICSIKRIQERTKENRTTEVWGLFDDLGRHVINIYHTIHGGSTLNSLLKFDRHTAIVTIIDKDISKQLKKESTVVKYKDSESKLLKK